LYKARKRFFLKKEAKTFIYWGPGPRRGHRPAGAAALKDTQQAIDAVEAGMAYKIQTGGNATSD